MERANFETGLVWPICRVESSPLNFGALSGVYTNVVFMQCAGELPAPYPVSYRDSMITKRPLFAPIWVFKPGCLAKQLSIATYAAGRASAIMFSGRPHKKQMMEDMSRVHNDALLLPRILLPPITYLPDACAPIDSRWSTLDELEADGTIIIKPHMLDPPPAPTSFARPPQRASWFGAAEQAADAALSRLDKAIRSFTFKHRFEPPAAPSEVAPAAETPTVVLSSLSAHIDRVDPNEWRNDFQASVALTVLGLLGISVLTALELSGAGNAVRNFILLPCLIQAHFMGVAGLFASSGFDSVFCSVFMAISTICFMMWSGGMVAALWSMTSGFYICNYLVTADHEVPRWAVAFTMAAFSAMAGVGPTHAYGVCMLVLGINFIDKLRKTLKYCHIKMACLDKEQDILTSGGEDSEEAFLSLPEVLAYRAGLQKSVAVLRRLWWVISFWVLCQWATHTRGHTNWMAASAQVVGNVALSICVAWVYGTECLGVRGMLDVNYFFHHLQKQRRRHIVTPSTAATPNVVLLMSADACSVGECCEERGPAAPRRTALEWARRVAMNWLRNVFWNEGPVSDAWIESGRDDAAAMVSVGGSAAELAGREQPDRGTIEVVSPFDARFLEISAP